MARSPESASWFQLPAVGAGQTERARLWAFACVAAGSLSAGFASFRLFTEEPLRGLVDLTVSALFLYAARDLIQLGRLRRSIGLAMLASAIAVLPSLFFGDPLGPVTFAWYGMLPMFATLGLGRRSVLWLALVVLPLPFLPLVLEGMGLARPSAVGWTTGLAVTVLFAGLSAMTWSYEVLQEKTERQRDSAEEALSHMRGMSASILAARDQLVRNVSHEFRTPLNHILGATQLLNETALDADQRELVAIAESSGQGLLGVIDGALTVHDLERGAAQLEEAPFDVQALLARVSQRFAGVAKKKGLRFVTTLDAAFPQYCRGDERVLEQVLGHLVDNAVAFTRRGSIELRADVDGKGRLRFEVEDSGIGIEEGAQERIFHPFVQLDASDTREHGGLGAGLAVSRLYARLMGGEITVRSTPGAGSTFTFQTPLDAGEGAARTGRPRPANEEVSGIHRTRKERVLLAEPNPRSRAAFVGTLEKSGFRPVGVGSEEELAQALDGEPFDVIFVDHDLAERESTKPRLQAARRAGAYLVALSPNEEGDRFTRAEQRGFDDRLPKPLRREQVLEMVRQWSGQRAS